MGVRRHPLCWVPEAPLSPFVILYKNTSRYKWNLLFIKYVHDILFFLCSVAVDNVLSMYVYYVFVVNGKHMELPSSGRATIVYGITPH